ncbi:MAG: ketopantoate reductase family protein [Acholeplasmatales bacterium]|nr:ketopantoate reductase family protein [Acholeplasmatales bacterium]
MIKTQIKIGIFGMGSVGASIYNELNGYPNLYALLDEDRIAKYKKNPLIINGNEVKLNMTSNLKMDLVILCVKVYHLDKALNDLKPFVDKNTIILPILNGIDANRLVKEVYPNNWVLFGAINVESNKEGNCVKTSKIMNLQFGDEYNYHLRYPLIEFKKIFDYYGIENHIYHNLKRRVWLKWIMNLAINQISAYGNYTYKDMHNDETLELMYKIFEEGYLVSKAYNIGITRGDIDELKYRCSLFESDRVTSLTLDVNKGGLNEAYIFGGRMVEVAKLKNIDIPYNTMVYNKLVGKIKEK